MNELMHVMKKKKMIHVMQEQIDACNAIMILGVHGLVIQVIPID